MSKCQQIWTNLLYVDKVGVSFFLLVMIAIVVCYSSYLSGRRYFGQTSALPYLKKRKQNKDYNFEKLFELIN